MGFGNGKRFFALIFALMAAAIVQAKVSPILENVTDRCDGTYRATFGYENSSSDTATLPIGPSNNFTGTGSSDAGQPTQFAPGRITNVFTIDFDGDPIVWTLDGATATAGGGAATNSCGFFPISPVLERVVDNCNGAYTAWFGYDNPNENAVTIDIGEFNRFTGAQDRGQPVSFESGRNVDVFSVDFDGGNLVWSLSGATATASGGAAENRCGLKPVSPVVERVVGDCNGNFVAWFGYNNENDIAVSIPHGDKNILINRTDQ
ncbi:MAG: hypothetical protein GF344_07725, partial [Chitinivibrionales bacterium]|nr:hypothetical protein [Chitinivibrionales bacterium]